MKPLFYLFVLLFAGNIQSLPDKPQRVIFFGDSITEAAVQPGGYIDIMRGRLSSMGRESEFELLGSGIGGNKIYDLYLRLETDVLDRNPDIVFIYIGINDIWHKVTSGTGTDEDKFVRFYEEILRKLKNRSIRVVIAAPAVIGEKSDNTNRLDGDLNRYGELIRGLAQRNSLPFVDLRAAFLRYNREHNPGNAGSGILTGDGVHLNERGNELVANLFLDTLLSLHPSGR